jgi:hypothetical protein
MRPAIEVPRMTKVADIEHQALAIIVFSGTPYPADTVLVGTCSPQNRNQDTHRQQYQTITVSTEPLEIGNSS